MPIIAKNLLDFLVVGWMVDSWMWGELRTEESGNISLALLMD